MKDFLFEILLTYNNKDIQSSHGLTPNEARKDNNRMNVLAGTLEGFNKMGRKPKMIYTDGEGALRSNLFEEFCNEEQSKLIITRTHAYVADRLIRTLKMQLED